MYSVIFKNMNRRFNDFMSKPVDNNSSIQTSIASQVMNRIGIVEPEKQADAIAVTTGPLNTQIIAMLQKVYEAPLVILEQSFNKPEVQEKITKLSDLCNFNPAKAIADAQTLIDTKFAALQAAIRLSLTTAKDTQQIEVQDKTAPSMYADKSLEWLKLKHKDAVICLTGKDKMFKFTESQSQLAKAIMLELFVIACIAGAEWVLGIPIFEFTADPNVSMVLSLVCLVILTFPWFMVVRSFSAMGGHAKAEIVFKKEYKNTDAYSLVNPRQTLHVYQVSSHDRMIAYFIFLGAIFSTLLVLGIRTYIAYKMNDENAIIVIVFLALFPFISALAALPFAPKYMSDAMEEGREIESEIALRTAPKKQLINLKNRKEFNKAKANADAQIKALVATFEKEQTEIVRGLKQRMTDNQSLATEGQEIFSCYYAVALEMMTHMFNLTQAWLRKSASGFTIEQQAEFQDYVNDYASRGQKLKGLVKSCINVPRGLEDLSVRDQLKNIDFPTTTELIKPVSQEAIKQTEVQIRKEIGIEK